MRSLIALASLFLLMSTAPTLYADAQQQGSPSQNATVTTQPPLDKATDGTSVEGVVTLSLVLRANGEVTDIKVAKVVPKNIPKDLVEKAKVAAKQIKFTPAERDGRPISQRVKIKYTFTLDE